MDKKYKSRKQKKKRERKRRKLWKRVSEESPYPEKWKNAHHWSDFQGASAKAQTDHIVVFTGFYPTEFFPSRKLLCFAPFPEWIYLLRCLESLEHPVSELRQRFRRKARWKPSWRNWRKRPRKPRRKPRRKQFLLPSECLPLLFLKGPQTVTPTVKAPSFGRIFPEEARHLGTRPATESVATISAWLSLPSPICARSYSWTRPLELVDDGVRFDKVLFRKMGMPYRQANYPRGLFKDWNETEFRNFIRCIAQYPRWLSPDKIKEHDLPHPSEWPVFENNMWGWKPTIDGVEKFVPFITQE